MTRNRTFLWIALISTLAAIGVHTYLTMHHYEMILGVARGKGLCNLGGAFDCDAVNTSKYSELFGRSIALWGAAVNSFLALMLIWHALTGSERLRRYAFYLSVFVASVSIVMGVISYTQIRVFCLFCSTVYVLSFLTALMLALYNKGEVLNRAGSDFRALLRGGAEGSRSVLIWGLVVSVLPVLAIHSSYMTAYGERLRWAVPESLDIWRSAQTHTFSEEGGLTKGAAADKAVLTLVEFADFRCPHCKTAVPGLHSFVKSRPDVRLIFLNFPLDSSCNSAMQQPGTSCAMAKAVYCANRAGKGWEAHDWLFDNQGKVTPESLTGLPGILGIDEGQFKSCTESSQTHDAVSAQAELGLKAGVKGTPTVYANGRSLPEGFMIPILEAVYDEVKK
ncbi:MAG TPA: vitamin K epoxide reductase family protein [Bdellovibrionales bacterium]|nr:vitamin K epoxide reductase family protein [Bdellovibrionales bacterium]